MSHSPVECRDGYDILEWLARQPWSNGKVAMRGGSYAGFDRWSTLKELPPHLVTSVPAALTQALISRSSKTSSPAMIQWPTLTSRVTPNQKVFDDSEFTSKFYEMYTAMTAVAPSVGSNPDCYVYDPLDTRPAELELQPNPNYLTDATGTLNLFDNGLVYHSAPFDNPTEITDTLKLTAWMVMEVPDTDFSVSVDEVLPSGPTVHLTQDAMRARYRE